VRAGSGCVDRAAPRSRFLRAGRRATRRGIVIRGRSSDRGCAAGGTGKVAVRVAGVAKPIEVRSADGAWRIESTPSVEPDKLPGGRAEHGADGG